MTQAQTGLQQLTAWRKAGKHLPRFMRDFHDQKALFKTVHALTGDPDPANPLPVTWVNAQIYVIDYFLWCMARHGYTLQKSRANMPFEDIHAAIKQVSDSEIAMLKSLFQQNIPANKGDS